MCLLANVFSNDASYDISNFCPEHRIQWKQDIGHNILPPLSNQKKSCVYILKEREKTIGGKGEKSLDLLMTILYYEYSSEVLKHDTLLYRSCWTNHTHKINSYNLVTTTELAYDGGLFTNVSTEAMPLSQSFHRSWKVGMLLQWGNNCQMFYIMEVQYLQLFSIKVLWEAIWILNIGG